MAQSSFTIVRPANNAKVRENIRLLFPMNSVGDTGYVGIFIGGKFLEAVKPGKGAEYLYYDLNTKARGIPDGPLTIEAVLYQDLANSPRIVDRSSITVNVANTSSIEVPEGGLKLRYKFTAGKQWIYKFENRIAQNNLSEINARTMSTENLLAGAEVSSIRLLYSVDNAYSNGDGLVRIQALTDKGKDSADLVTSSNPDKPQTFYDYQMHPIYMRLSNTGREIFGSAPTYFPLEGTTAEAFRTDLYALFPLPMLPSSPIKPGDPAQVGIQLGDLDLNKKAESDSMVTVIPQVRGDFIGVEWEMNHPTAHLRYTRGEKMPDGFKSRGTIINAQNVVEDIYFALDLGTVLKLVRTYTIDTKITAPVGGGAGGNTPGAGIAGGGGGVPTPQGVGAAGGGQGGRGSGGGPGGVGSGFMIPPTLGGFYFPMNQNLGSGGPPPGITGAGRQGGPPGLAGASQQGTQNQGNLPGNFGRGTRTGGNATRIVKLTIQETFTLENR